MRPKQRTLASVSALLILLICLHYIGWLSPVERTIRHIVQPISATAYEAGVRLADGATPQNQRELVEAYNAMYERYQKQLVEQATIERLTRENEELKEQLSFQEQFDGSMIGATVIGKDIDPLGSAVVIDRGEKDGITKGQPVIVANGVLVGLVHSTTWDTASVLLIDDSQSSVAATIYGQEQSLGIVEGGFGLSIRMSFIPQNEEIEVDQLIATSGLTHGIPPGLLIGTVEAIEREAYQPFQTAIVTPAADLDKLFFLNVLLTDVNPL